MNDELERIWKEAVMAYFKVLCRNLPRGAEENYENLMQYRRSSGLDLNQGPPPPRIRTVSSILILRIYSVTTKNVH
jgi:hypothetical protein